MKNNNFNHRKLCEDLALAKQTIFVEVPLGSVWAGQLQGLNSSVFLEWSKRNLRTEKEIEEYRRRNWGKGTQIGDVVVVRPSYTNFCIDIYEVKVRRSDFLKEIRSEKWKGYLPHCHRFYFACLSDIIWGKKEIPEPAGLIIRGERGWRTAKRAVCRDITVPHETLLSMLFFRQKGFRSWRSREKVLGSWIGRERAFKRLGSRITDVIHFWEKETGKMFGWDRD